MRNIATKIVIFFSLVAFKTIFAASAITCSPVKVKVHEENSVLPGSVSANQSQIYFLQNVSKKSLWIDHPTERPGTPNAGWSSYLQPGRWSAILLAQKDFAINCAIIEPGKAVYQDCSQVISVCAPQQISINSKRKGSYWLVENQSWDGLLKALSKRMAKDPGKKT